MATPTPTRPFVARLDWNCAERNTYEEYCLAHATRKNAALWILANLRKSTDRAEFARSGIAATAIGASVMMAMDFVPTDADWSISDGDGSKVSGTGVDEQLLFLSADAFCVSAYVLWTGGDSWCRFDTVQQAACWIRTVLQTWPTTTTWKIDTVTKGGYITLYSGIGPDQTLRRLATAVETSPDLQEGPKIVSTAAPVGWRNSFWAFIRRLLGVA